ncbi:MAG: hypothetical protein JNK45_22380 [Myxococcales bacterium]|jgi:hypothetical protein|nr:hypothetical protein [Myxococcales bacterium]
MRPVRPLCGALLTLLVAACDLGSSDDGDVLALIDDVITLGNDNVAIVCDCWDEAGFASRTDCLDDQILPSQRRCVEEAYQRDPDAARLYLECVVPLVRELGECLDARLSCVDPSGTDACFDDYDLGRESCVEVPRSVQRALDDCDAGGSDSAPTPDDSGPAPGGPDPAPDDPDPSGGAGEPTDPPAPEPTDPPAPEPTDPPAPAPGGGSPGGG